MKSTSFSVLQLPQRSATVRRYVDIIRYALGKKQSLSAVADHFDISPATVINASKAFGLTYEEVKNRRTIPRMSIVEKELASGSQINERTRKVLEYYHSPSVPTLKEIGQYLGLSRQRIHQILLEAQGKGVKVARRKPKQGHWVERCQVCSKMRELAEYKSLITTKKIAQSLEIPTWKVYWHLQKLRSQNLVPAHFGHFRSDRIILAIKMYNLDPSISAWKLGRQLGYKNLPALFRELRRRGFAYLLSPRKSTFSEEKIINVNAPKKIKNMKVLADSVNRTPSKRTH